jgi:hypothetical protein
MSRAHKILFKNQLFNKGLQTDKNSQLNILGRQLHKLYDKSYTGHNVEQDFGKDCFFLYARITWKLVIFS